jgi:hypothetical protein
MILCQGVAVIRGMARDPEIPYRSDPVEDRPIFSRGRGPSSSRADLSRSLYRSISLGKEDDEGAEEAQHEALKVRAGRRSFTTVMKKRRLPAREIPAPRRSMRGGSESCSARCGGDGGDVVRVEGSRETREDAAVHEMSRERLEAVDARLARFSVAQVRTHAELGCNR